MTSFLKNIGPFLIGLLFCYTLVKLTKEKAKFLRSSKKAMGEVKSIELAPSTDSYQYWKVKIKFEDELNRSFIFEPANSTKKPKYSIGDLIAVRYDPKDPTHVYYSRYFSLWGFEILFLIFFAGVILFWYTK